VRWLVFCDLKGVDVGGMMNRSGLARGILVVLPVLLFLVCVLSTVADAQGLQQSPYNPADAVRRGASGGIDLSPSNPLGLPGSAYRGQAGSDTVSLSSGMFPGTLRAIPNLQIGYLYNFGPNVRSGRFTADYLLPLNLGRESTVFGEAHTEFQSFWNTNSFNSRVDVSLGGGYRTFLRGDTLVGVNGFYDTSRLGGTWYSSGGVGLEMAALLPGNDAIDVNFNWYGQIFNSTVIQNAFRYGPSNFDFQAGYSHELWNGGPDLRLSATGYKFDAGSSVYGWNAGAELKSRDGVFVLRYNVGNDQVNQTYQTVGGFVNVGFQPEHVLKGESPFVMPEPIFKSPRSLWYMLTQTVKRNWHQPTTVIIVQNAGGQGGAPSCLSTTAIPGIINPGLANSPFLIPQVPFTTSATFNSVTVTFTNAPPGPGGSGGVQLVGDIGGNAVPAIFFAPGQTTQTRSKAAFPQWFNGTGFPGSTRWSMIYIVNPGGNPPWDPGVVTVTWCP
jgi:hypothetical protein